MDKRAEFLEAVKRGEASTISYLLDRYSDLARIADEHGKTGLHWTAEMDHADVARLLIHAGAEVEAKTFFGSLAARMGSDNGECPCC